MKQQRRPWGAVSGLMAGSLATLVGVIRRLDPDVIALRALLAAAAVGVVVAVVVGIAGPKAEPN